jgi:hypothetical protein
MISPIYHSAPIVAGRGLTQWAPGSKCPRKGRFTLRMFCVPANWKPGEHGYILCKDRRDAERQARLYRTFDVAVQRVSADERRWYVRFL